MSNEACPGHVHLPTGIAVHCPGCAESASLRQRLATAEAERDRADRDHGKTIDERDRREDQLEKIAVILGCTEEWTNLHDHGACAIEAAHEVASALADAAALREQLLAAEVRERDNAVAVRDVAVLHDQLSAVARRAYVAENRLATAEALALTNGERVTRAEALLRRVDDLRDTSFAEHVHATQAAGFKCGCPYCAVEAYLATYPESVRCRGCRHPPHVGRCPAAYDGVSNACGCTTRTQLAPTKPDGASETKETDR